MGTKKLSRTVLEGGHASEYRERRVQENVRLRRRVKLACRRAVCAYRDGDGDEDIDIHPVLPASSGYGEKFTDKLSPAWRYLRSRHGWLWDDVWSELCSSFDVRGLAGYHVLIQHVRREVMRDRFRRNPEFWVDDAGVLRWRDADGAAGRAGRLSDGHPVQAFLCAARGRTYERDGDAMYWIESQNPWLERCMSSDCFQTHTWRVGPDGVRVRVHSLGRVSRRTREFSSHEYRLWHALKEHRAKARRELRWLMGLD